MAYEQLKLSNQLCFRLYTASRLITQSYKPLLDNLGITYPQYLVLMVLVGERQPARQRNCTPLKVGDQHDHTCPPAHGKTGHRGTHSRNGRLPPAHRFPHKGRARHGARSSQVSCGHLPQPHSMWLRCRDGFTESFLCSMI